MSLKDIAREAHTSVSTVSRVLNNPHHNCQNSALEEKIWDIARKQHYTPNSNARNLRLNSNQLNNSFTIDIFITRFESIEIDPFFHELYQYIKEEILSNGCILGDIINTVDIVAMSEESIAKVPYKTHHEILKQKQKNPLATIIRKDNTGLIILGKCPNEMIDSLKKRYPYIVGIDRNPTNYEYDEVICNGLNAAETAVEHLIKLGHRNIAYIGDCTYETRYIGYYQALFNHKIQLNYNNIFPSTQTEESGYKIGKRILKMENPPSGIFCANDITAIGVLRAVKSGKKKYRPSIISIDNILQSERTVPMLTTIDIPKKEMGHLAIAMLIDRKNKKHKNNLRLELPCKLIERESCNYL